MKKVKDYIGKVKNYWNDSSRIMLSRQVRSHFTETIEVQGENFVLLEEFRENGINYAFFASIETEDNYALFKGILDENGKEYWISLEDYSEFETLFYRCYEKHVEGKLSKQSEIHIEEKYNFTKIKTNLEEKGYVVNVFEDKESAAAYVSGQIQGKTVGIGGSVTVRQMNLFPMLSENNNVYWHDEKPENLTVKETRTIATRAEIYISSVNGISETGEIVNIDNTGNRVAAISYGPEKVYLLVGVNKVEKNLEDAIYRARNVAAPLNAQRLKRNTPCAEKANACYDCKSPERICRNLSVLWTKPTGAEYEVVLINEKLGF